MTDKISITVGIPAYNEEANIKSLIFVLLNQVLSSAVLSEIIVVVDACTDFTADEVRSIDDHRIKIIEHTTRQGLCAGQNEIVRLALGDILVLLDADVLPKGLLFLENIVQPILADPEVGIVGADTISATPKKFIERVIANSHEVKTSLYRSFKNGNNVYLCHGRARAFSRHFFTTLTWPLKYSEDSYSYLYCVQKHFKFVYAPTAQIIFRSPQNISDHLRQSLRFVHGQNNLIKTFPSGFAEREYTLPWTKVISAVAKALLRHPILMSTYVIITLWGRILYPFNRVHNHSIYEPSKTSKRV